MKLKQPQIKSSWLHMALRLSESISLAFVRVIQSIGRGIRKAEDKDFVQIWDITSTCKYAKRHLTERKRFYKEAKYPFTLTKVDIE